MPHDTSVTGGKKIGFRSTLMISGIIHAQKSMQHRAKYSTSGNKGGKSKTSLSA